MWNVKCQMSNVKCQMTNDKRQMSNIKWQMSNVEYKMTILRSDHSLPLEYVYARCREHWAASKPVYTLTEVDQPYSGKRGEGYSSWRPRGQYSTNRHPTLLNLRNLIKLKYLRNRVFSFWLCPIVQLGATFGWCSRRFSWPLPCHQWGRMKSVPANVTFLINSK